MINNKKFIIFFIFLILLLYVLSSYIIIFFKINNSKLKKKQLSNQSKYRWNIFDKQKKCVLGYGTIAKQIINKYKNIDIIHHNELNKLLNYDIIFLTYKVKNISEKDSLLYIDNILYNLKNNTKQIVNFNSEAEIVYLPNRLEYGKIKKKINEKLHNSNHIIYSIYLPYAKFINISKFFDNFDSNYIYHYPSIISQYLRPCYINTLICNHNIYKKKDLMEKYSVLLFEPLFKKSWTLTFKGKYKKGKLHKDKNRCVGTTFRVLKIIKNTSDSKILINNKIYDNNTNRNIFINNNIIHQALNTNYGDRILNIYDYNTSFDNIYNSIIVSLIIFLKKISYNF